MVKAKQPTVCFLGRWDKRKRPEVFFELARQHPDVSFIAMGNAQGRRRDQGLRLRYGDIPNLEMTGFIDQFSSRRFEEILSRSWILVNTSELEGLPRAFLEAAFHECAILASVDPDGFASRFGYRVTDGNYSGGLQTLLNDSKWRGLGKQGRAHVESTHGREAAVSHHLRVYEGLMRRRYQTTSAASATAEQKQPIEPA